MQITDLGGHSGCKILLCEEDDNSTFVRKISSSQDYNDRLKQQAEKQKSFNSTVIKAPSVKATGYTEEGLFYFDMEYIQGITLAEYMNTIEIGKVRGLVEAIVNNMIAIGETTSSEPNIFIKKIESLEEKLLEKNNGTINKALELLKMHDWSLFTKTKCHGDMTLENIIVKDNQLYLIDFLDSFYDCWILDVSTLLQDVQVLWSYRKEKDININKLLRVIVFRDILLDEIKKHLGIHYIEVYYALLLKLIRIFPYTKDKETFDFLIGKTSMVMNLIQEADDANSSCAMCR